MIIQQKRIRSVNRHFEHIEDDSNIILGVPINEDLKETLYQIGFSNDLVVGETVLPTISFGNVSKFNAEGKEIPLKDQPMETAYRQVEWHWEEWRGAYDTEEMSKIVDVPYERYPRKFIPPPSIELSIANAANGTSLIVSPIFEYKEENHEIIIHTVNLILEIFKICHVFSENLEAITVPNLRRLNWTVLPEGKYPWERLREHVEPILEQASEGKRPVIQYRLETVLKYNPDFMAVGRAGFTGYMIFGFPQKNLYICESAFYGNATYVFEENWESLSKLTKAEILSENLQKDRLIHL